jgi:hypothetical protein
VVGKSVGIPISLFGAVVIRHRPYWAPPSGTATLRDKFPGKYFPSFIPPGFATTSNLYTTASLLTLRVPNLAYFFQPELLIPESTLSYIQGSCYLSQIGPLRREFTSHKIRAYNKETSADPACGTEALEAERVMLHSMWSDNL